ncbi:MAG TPA: gluconate 2-dehydrogenase subunit 3 family protein [Bryobacteraceae bacterium]|nr:gluconate 2-dehydrogenase subunit 3 family protein [Bryobacteraceae bacterium]
MNRREVIKTGAAAAALTTIATGQEHVHGTLLAPETVIKQGRSWKPAVLTPAQNETVVVLSEIIIPTTDTPGAKAAMVNRYIDLFLSASSQEDKDRFMTGLAWFEDYASKQNGTPFVKQDPAAQVALLEKLDRAESDTSLGTGFRFFRMMKSMTSRFYYQTQIGYKELNKGGVPATFACKHPNHSAPAAD